MSRRVEAYIDGIALTQAVPGAIIRQITEDAPQMEQTAANNPGADGQRLVGLWRRTRKISVEFVIREIHSLSTRSMLQEAAAEWARDGWLSVSYRPDRRIRVHCTQAPVIGAARDYTQVLRAEFTAASPWWEDSHETELALEGASGSGTLFLPGSTRYTQVDAEITPTEGPLTSITLRGRDSALIFADLYVAAGQQLLIGHTDEGWLSAKAAGSDCMSCMSRDSADDLLASPGKGTAMSYTADTACSVSFKARGRYR